MGYFRSAIDAMMGYALAQQPAPGTKIIKLNTNENPYSPSQRVVKALQTIPVSGTI